MKKIIKKPNRKLFYLKLLLLVFITSSSYSQEFTGPITLEINEQGTYEADMPTDNYFWSATGSLQITSPSNTGISVNVIKTSNAPGILYLVAYSDTYGATNQSYCFNKTILSLPPPSCNSAFHNISIENYVCITDSHPYWRFKLLGNYSNATITWSGDHFNVITGVNGSYMIGNPSTPGDFTVYCTLKERSGQRCEKTFYYTSNSNVKYCNEGETGELGGNGTGILDPVSFKSENNNNNTFSISPNPVKEDFLIQVKTTNKKQILTVKIHDIFGNLISTPINNKTINSVYSKTINNHNLKSNRIYFALFYLDGKLSHQEKLIHVN